MSDLYRSAMSARLAKLPVELPPTTVYPTYNEEDEDEDEEGDVVGDLPPGSGLGPPAMQVTLPDLACSAMFMPIQKARSPSTDQLKLQKGTKSGLCPNFSIWVLRRSSPSCRTDKRSRLSGILYPTKVQGRYCNGLPSWRGLLRS